MLSGVDMLLSVVVDEVYQSGLLKSAHSICGRKTERGLGFVLEGEIRRSEWLLSRQPVRSSNNDAVSCSFINHTHTISTFVHSVNALRSTPILRADRRGDGSQHIIFHSYSPLFLKTLHLA